MGSKTALLRGSLGELLLREAAQADRFIDLFSGSAAVSHYVAERLPISVLSVDAQEYSRPLAGAIVGRTCSLADSTFVADWVKRAADDAKAMPGFSAAIRASRIPSKTSVTEARRLCRRSQDGSGFIWRHYGGHYFSPYQALVLDALYRNMPSAEPSASLALAALLRTASRCAAAPGHTAQPFQPTPALLPYLGAAWARDPLAECQDQLDQLAPRHALKLGRAVTADCFALVPTLREGDLAFCDPPYSAVQYSRFYHVLEGMARGGWPLVSGAGRAPDGALRIRSPYSMKSRALHTFAELLRLLSRAGVTVIVTFPAGIASNGVSGRAIVEMAESWFHKKVHLLPSVHSTLGGPAGGGEATRGARIALHEIALELRPRR